MTAATATPGAAAPRCGSCGYDTTGLTTLTCPECGADLRAAGISRGGPGYTFGTFVVSGVAMLIAWVLCGAMLTDVASSLTPRRQHVRQTTSLTAPRSGAYKGVTVVAAGSGWPDQQPAMRVEVSLVPPDAAPPPPPPLAAAHRVTTDDVLKWFASAKLDATDPRVLEEAQVVALTATRGLRMRGRLGSGFGWGGSSYSSTVGTSGAGTPFNSSSHNVTGTTTTSNLHTVLFGVLWVAVLACGVTFLLRLMAPFHRRHAAPH
jgi:hypothetical protein